MIGHSLGGGIAMTMAHQYPERVGRLGLVASAGLGRHLHPLLRVATLPVRTYRPYAAPETPGPTVADSAA